MEENTRIGDLKLQDLYWQLILAKKDEYINNKLTGRLIIDFQQGRINSIFDQAVISGVTVTQYNLGKSIDFTES